MDGDITELFCCTPLVHSDESASSCIMPKYHYITVEDSDHEDIHGCTAHVLVRQASIREVQRVQRNHDEGFYDES